MIYPGDRWKEWATSDLKRKRWRSQEIMCSWCEKHLYIQNCAEIRLITADLQIYTQYSRCKCFFFYFVLFVWLCHGRNVWSWAKRKLSEKPGILRGYYVVLVLRLSAWGLSIQCIDNLQVNLNMQSFYYNHHSNSVNFFSCSASSLWNSFIDRQKSIGRTLRDLNKQ